MYSQQVAKKPIRADRFALVLSTSLITFMVARSTIYAVIAANSSNSLSYETALVPLARSLFLLLVMVAAYLLYTRLTSKLNRAMVLLLQMGVCSTAGIF